MIDLTGQCIIKYSKDTDPLDWGEVVEDRLTAVLEHNSLNKEVLVFRIKDLNDWAIYLLDEEGKEKGVVDSPMGEEAGYQDEIKQWASENGYKTDVFSEYLTAKAKYYSQSF